MMLSDLLYLLFLHRFRTGVRDAGKPCQAARRRDRPTETDFANAVNYLTEDDVSALPVVDDPA
jgi:hypothetical protein